MTTVHHPYLLVHDEVIKPDGSGDRTWYQPENFIDFTAGSEAGVTFQLDIHAIQGTADSWYMTNKFQIGMGDVDGAAYSKRRWRDLQAEQISKLIVEGLDWYGGTPNPFTVTNPVTNPSLETVSTGWSAISGTGGTAAGARLTTNGYIGGASYRITWSVATTSSGSGGVGGPLAPITSLRATSGSMYARPSKAQWLRANIEFRDAGGAVLQTRQGPSVLCAANVWTLLKVENKLAPSTATQARITVTAGAGSSLWAAGDTLDGDANIITVGETVLAYFDGDSDGGAWTGTAHASASTMTITPATPELNIVARSTDILPITVSRTVWRFGRFVRVFMLPVAVNPSSDFGVRLSLTASH